MGRLQISLCLACLLLTASPAYTQQNSTTDNADITFVVAGDVARPHEYTVADAPFSLRQALLHAGMLSEGVNVVVIRNLEGNGQWSHFISRNGSDSGPEIRNGDVLVAYASGQMDGPVVPNSVFVNGQYAFVIGLDSQVNTGVVAGQVLERLGESSGDAGLLQIVSGRPGRARRSVGLNQEIQHGDILVMRSTGRLSGSAQRGFSPQVSEWREPAAGSLPSSMATGSDANAGSANDFAVPLMNSGSLQLPIPAASQTLQEDALSRSPEGGGLAFSSSSDVEQPPANGELSTGDVFQVAVPLPVEPEQLRMASLQQPSPTQQASSTYTAGLAEAKTVPVSDPSAGALPAANGESAPLPPSSLQQPVETAAYNAWNTLFVVGLILAGVLIVGGWLKSEAEMRQMQMISAVGAMTSASSPTAAAAPATSLKVAPSKEVSAAGTFAAATSELKDSSLGDSETAICNTAEVSDHDAVVRQEHVAPEEQVDPNAAAVQPLVKPEEWFAADWIPAVVVSADASVASGTVSVGGQEPVTSEAHAAIDRWSEQNQQASPANCGADSQVLMTNASSSPTRIVSSTDDSVQSCGDDRANGADLANAADNGVPDRDAFLSSSDEMQTESSRMQEIVGDQNEELTAGRSSGFEELTDLIENRLPVDLCDARLPLRISLFGTPAGPKRLRIVAAHKQLAGPHMPLTAERRKTSAMATAATTIAERQASHADGQAVMAEGASLADSKSAAVSEADAPVPDRAAGSLDRALNFLNEQGN